MYMLCAYLQHDHVTMSCLPSMSDRAAMEGSKYLELRWEPHKVFNSKYLLLPVAVVFGWIIIIDAFLFHCYRIIIGLELTSASEHAYTYVNRGSSCSASY